MWKMLFVPRILKEHLKNVMQVYAITRTWLSRDWHVQIFGNTEGTWHHITQITEIAWSVGWRLWLLQVSDGSQSVLYIFFYTLLPLFLEVLLVKAFLLYQPSHSLPVQFNSLFHSPSLWKEIDFVFCTGVLLWINEI